MDETALMNLVLKVEEWKLTFKKHGKCKSQCTEFSIKSNESHMKIFPKASFGNPHALIDSRLLKIWSLIMLAHIILKPEMYLIVLFIVSNVKHAHTERICESFEESYHLHPCIKIKIWIIFPQTSLVNSNEFVCEFCT